MRQYATTTMSSTSATTATPPTAATPTNSHSYLLPPPAGSGLLPPPGVTPSISDLRTSYLTDNTDVGSSSAGGGGTDAVVPLDGHQTIVDSYPDFLSQSPPPPPPPPREPDPFRTVDLDEEAGQSVVFGGRV